MTTWDSVLEAFALRLADQRAALLEGNPESVPPFVPPRSIGPIPDALRTRAEALLQEALGLEAEMAGGLASATREVQVVQRFIDATSSTRSNGTFVDSPL